VSDKQSEACSVDEFVSLDALQEQLKTFFPSDTSLSWHLRQHRAEYITAGAIIVIGRRVFAHPEKFKRTMPEVAARAAAKRMSETS
jgi:hypothetical protein